MDALAGPVLWRDLDAAAKQQTLRRPAQRAAPQVQDVVKRIVAAVRADGDAAVRAFSKEFDGVDAVRFNVTAGERGEAWAKLSVAQRRALEVARANIEKFHTPQKPRTIAVEIESGQECRRVWHPLRRVGLYVPGGSAPLPSTLLMLAIPARIAGCQEIVVCTPPAADGLPASSIMAVAELLGIESVCAVGGAQAVAAMAFGCPSMAKVDKIFGPGNAYVTAAKTLCAQDPEGAAIDLPAGPSEVMVIADQHANPEFVASDLLSQAEHGTDSHVVLLASTPSVALAVQAAVDEQVVRLSRRVVAQGALQHMTTIVFDDLDIAVEISNAYAPEHLILQVEEGRLQPLIDGVVSSGSIFVGPWTPEAVGDYASGTNHVLPTYGFGRAYSGLGVEDFMRATTVQRLTREALLRLAPTVETLAAMEGLDGHAEAVAIRRRAATAAATLEASS